MTLLDFIETAVKATALIVALLGGFAYMTWGERRIVARMQWRLGPNRTGPAGLIQPMADGLKLLFKEQLMPANARTFIFLLAPCISLVVALSGFAVIPVGMQHYNIFGYDFQPWVADLDISVLYLLGISSLGVYGIILGGWSSNNKYALLGAIRSSAQVISYELALGTALISPLMMVGSLSFLKIVEAQTTGGGCWLAFSQPVAFLLYCTAAVAEVNRAPFDLPEAEQELGAGYHTEYSGMKFAMFFMAEYVNMFTVSAVATTVFLGGPSFFGFLPQLGPFYFVIKVYLFMFGFIWLRATLPRFRYDQLMRIGWQFLLPMGLLNLAVTATGVALGANGWQIGGSVVLMVGLLWALSVGSRSADHSDGHLHHPDLHHSSEPPLPASSLAAG